MPLAAATLSARGARAAEALIRVVAASSFAVDDVAVVDAPASPEDDEEDAASVALEAVVDVDAIVSAAIAVDDAAGSSA